MVNYNKNRLITIFLVSVAYSVLFYIYFLVNCDYLPSLDPVRELPAPLNGWLQLYESTPIRPRFYEHSTTYAKTVGLPVVGCCTAA